MIAPEALELLKKQVQTLRSMDHSEYPLSVCDKACEVAEAIETLIAAYEEQAKVVEKLGGKTSDGVRLGVGDTAYLGKATIDSSMNWIPDDVQTLTLRLGAPHSYEDFADVSDLYSTAERAREAAIADAAKWNKIDADCKAEEAALAATPAAESERGDE